MAEILPIAPRPREEEQQRRLYLLDLLERESGFQTLGIVAMTAIPRGVRFLFGYPTYLIVNITFTDDAWSLYLPSLNRTVQGRLTDEGIVLTLRSVVAGCSAWAAMQSARKRRQHLRLCR